MPSSFAFVLRHSRNVLKTGQSWSVSSLRQRSLSAFAVLRCSVPAGADSLRL